MSRLKRVALLGAVVVTIACQPAAGPAGGRTASPTGQAAPTIGQPAPTAPSVAIDPAASRYVTAVNARDINGLVAAFAADAEIIDVSRSIRGQDAIRRWATAEVIGGRLEVISITPYPGGQDLLVHWAPAGSAGWRAHYRFDIAEGRIVRADLQYA